MPIFRVKSVKIYTGQKNLHGYIRGIRDKYQVWLMLRRRMGFIMITRVKKYCKFSDDFYWFFQLQHDSWWDSLVCRGDINRQIMLSHCTSNKHYQSRLFLQNISRWFWGQRTDSESLFHRGCSEVENIFSWCFNKNNFS